MSFVCLNLSDLPRPPKGKTGWPWTDDPSETNYDPSVDWPVVSVVTPSYNQGWALEETIRSVVMQRYPRLEFYVIDGGSTDNSVDIIRKYEKWITGWVSEPDGGQSEAINKGFRRLKGEWCAWLNSDDYYMPNALFRLVETALQLDSHIVVVSGGCNIVNREGVFQRVCFPKNPTSWPVSWNVKPSLSRGLFFQPATIMRKAPLQNVGFLDESLHFTMDYDLWIRLSKVGNYAVIDDLNPVASARFYDEAKSCKRDVRQIVEGIHVLFKNGKLYDADDSIRELRQMTVDKTTKDIMDMVTRSELFDEYMNNQPCIRIMKYFAKRLLKSSYKRFLRRK